MPPEASAAVRDLLAVCGARWSGQHGAADEYLAGLSEDRLRAVLRWVPPLVGEALDFPAGLSRAAFVQATAGQADIWDDEKNNGRGGQR